MSAMRWTCCNVGWENDNVFQFPREQGERLAGNMMSKLSQQRCSFDRYWTKDCPTKDIAWTSWWAKDYCTIRCSWPKFGLIDAAPCSTLWLNVLHPNQDPLKFVCPLFGDPFYSLRQDALTFVFPGDGNHGTSKCLSPHCTLGVRALSVCGHICSRLCLECCILCHNILFCVSPDADHCRKKKYSRFLQVTLFKLK